MAINKNGVKSILPSALCGIQGLELKEEYDFLINIFACSTMVLLVFNQSAWRCHAVQMWTYLYCNAS